MLKSSLCDYGDSQIHVKETITVPNRAAEAVTAINTDKKIIFEKCATFTDRINEINNTQVDDAKNINVVIPMYKLIEYSDIYPKTSGILWQNHKDVRALDNSCHIAIF